MSAIYSITLDITVHLEKNEYHKHTKKVKCEYLTGANRYLVIILGL